MERVTVEKVIALLEPIAVEVRRQEGKTIVILPFGTEIQLYEDGESVQMDVMAYIAGYELTGDLNEMSNEVDEIADFASVVDDFWNKIEPVSWVRRGR